MIAPELLHRLQGLEFYLSSILPCPYLPERQERKLFARLADSTAAAVADNSLLTQNGFRRSHAVMYRPACPACRACVPVRVPVTGFQPSRTQRRLAQRTAVWAASMVPAVPNAEQFQLFQRYQQARHGASDMAQMDFASYQTMLTEGNAALRLLTLRTPQDDALQGVMLVDHLTDGLSAIYSFYAPESAAYSLGTVMILRLLAAAAAAQLPYVYLGYWVAGSRTMAYKNQFRPQQHLTAAGWHDVII
jgi:leucyl-tRNA---protein transferase